MKKRFLIGLGCQKGGSSWMAQHLAATPGVRLGPHKEMHVLDTHFISPEWLARRIRVQRDALARLAPGQSDERVRLARQLGGLELSQGLVGDLDAYARYFRGLAEGAELVADITPNYALLGAAHWAEVRDALERNGLAPRLVFLMRDPEGRMESAWRMHERNGPARQDTRKPGLRGMLRRIGGARREERPYIAFSNANIARSRYEATIRAIEAVFPAEDIHYEFYESLFQPEAIAALSAFLGVTERPADFGKRVNSSPARSVIPPEQRAQVRALLEPTYQFCAERFGAARVRALWSPI